MTNLGQPTFWDDLNNEANYSDPVYIEELLISILALKFVPGCGIKTILRLFDNNLLPNYLRYPNEFNIQKVLKNIPSFSKTHNFVATHNEELLSKGKFLAERLQVNQIQFIPVNFSNYPKSLRKIPDSPRWIFVKGNIDTVNSQSIIAIVGTRKASLDGQRLAYFCSSLFARKNIVVLSGLANGIDEKAHEGSLAFFGQTIAVLGYGFFSKYYSERNNLEKKILDCEGAIISEYLPYDEPTEESFLRRNYLQVALSKCVIPVECPLLESGTGATIRRAQKLNVPVIGITAKFKNINPDILQTTKENLQNLDIKTFEITNGKSELFWDMVKELLVEHKWNSINSDFENRCFRIFLHEINDGFAKLNLEIDAKKRFANFFSENFS
jgi:DNA processing protein